MLVLQRYNPVRDWSFAVTVTVTHRFNRYGVQPYLKFTHGALHSPTWYLPPIP
jgi:hypothetical protein